MAECDYCGQAFDGEEALLGHMRDEHEGELGRIDQRRVADLEGDGDGLPTGPIALAFIIFASAAVVAFVIFGGGSSGANTGDVAQTPYGQAHEHGTMEVVILGEQVDFSQSKYQVADQQFHFEGGDGRVWHAHAQGITVEYALATLDIDVNESSVTYQGTTYRDGEGYSVEITVNGEPVNPKTHVLEGASASNPEAGDHVEVVVERTNASE